MDQHRFSALILDKLNNSISATDEKELQEAINSNEVYANQYRFFLEYWNNQEADHTNSQRLFNDLSSRIATEENRQPIAVRKSSKPWVYFAAASIVVLVSSTLLLFKSSAPEQITSISRATTANNRGRTIRLEDGTVITLNEQSSISGERMTAEKREVTLVGEAFFSVTKDRKRPFMVHTDKMDILVLGTEFNVSAYPSEQQQAALIHGSIKVTLHDAKRTVIYLRPDDRLTIDKGIKQAQLDKLEHYDSTDTAAVVETAWMSGHLVFRDKSFESLATQLEQRYHTSIVFQSEEARKHRFNGTFTKENLQEVLYILSRTGSPFTYQFKEGKVYIN